MSPSNTEMHSAIETLILHQSMTLVGPDVEKRRVRSLSLLPRPAQQCQLQCGRICKISGNTWLYFYFLFSSFILINYFIRALFSVSFLTDVIAIFIFVKILKWEQVPSSTTFIIYTCKSKPQIWGLTSNLCTCLIRIQVKN